MSYSYFAYGYNKNDHTAKRICRHIDNVFERYDREKAQWVAQTELRSILIGNNFFYEEIDEDEANEIIGNGAVHIIFGI